MPSFFTLQEWADGGLRERMVAEGLPALLITRHSNNGRIERREYSCSEELCLALLRAGAPLEITEWTSAILEHRRLA